MSNDLLDAVLGDVNERARHDEEEREATKGYTFLVWGGCVVEWRADKDTSRPRFDTWEEARQAGIAEAERRRQWYMEQIIGLSVSIADMEKMKRQFQEATNG